jgi:hypothetical protein
VVEAKAIAKKTIVIIVKTDKIIRTTTIRRCVE